jgi:excinuclease ABC subunit C
MMIMSSLESQINGLPEKTGVYMLKGDTVLYVGKASNLKKRVKNHFQAAKSNSRESLIVNNTKKIDYIVTGSDVEALIEENILIKQYKPKYNIRLRDDKTYPYFKLSLEEDFPTLTIVRRPKKDKNRYFGPYANVAAMRKSLNTLRNLFPLIACKFDPKKPRKRPCIYHQMDLCSGICAGLITKEEYYDRVKSLLLVLEGKTELVIQKLKGEMLEASTNLEYEKAGLIRDRITALEKILSGMTIIFPKPIDLDVLAVVKTRSEACLQVLQIKSGKLVSSESYDLDAQNAEDNEIIESFIKQYYSKRIYSPGEIIVPIKLQDISTIQNWLLERFNSKTKISSVVRGQKRRLLNLAIENAKSHLNELEDKKKKTLKALKELQKTLNLDNMPKLIECFDISTLTGKSSAGSMITFKDGESLKSGYRRFKIKTVVGQDDPKMISEIVHRRYRRLVEERKQLPDLVIVDGGITQLNSATRSLKKLGLELPVIGLAKKFDHIYVKKRLNPIVLPKNSEALYLIQRIRDEAHRFAITYHRKLRTKEEIR